MTSAREPETEPPALSRRLAARKRLARQRFGAFVGRVEEFELQARSAPSEEWKTFVKGTTLGETWERSFDAVTARFVRLDIQKATEGPTIWELLLFPPKRT